MTTKTWNFVILLWALLSGSAAIFADEQDSSNDAANTAGAGAGQAIADCAFRMMLAEQIEDPKAKEMMRTMAMMQCMQAMANNSAQKKNKSRANKLADKEEP